MERPNLNELSDDDLLKALDATEEVVVKVDTEIEAFLKAWDIKPGKHTVNMHMIYKFYVHTTNRDIAKKQFYEQFKSLISTDAKNRCKLNMSETMLNAIMLNHVEKNKQPSLHLKHFNEFLKWAKIDSGNDLMVEDELIALYRKYPKTRLIGNEKFLDYIEKFLEYATRGNKKYYYVQKKEDRKPST